MTQDLQAFKSLITQRCGLMIEGHGEQTLEQALSARTQALGISLADYHARLCHSVAEFQELVNLLTINETYFFREPEQIRLLVNRLAPRFLAHGKGATPVRILSAGCSSGEEPYSLVMALMEKYGESAAQLFSVHGGDIDSNVLTKARLARYGGFSFRGVSAELRGRYFNQDGACHTLKSQVKHQVSFHELNLLASSFPTALQGFDIIFLRNVSIYFDPPTRKIIQRNLASLMKTDGVLVIGIAETLANDLGVLPLVEEDGLFYFTKGHPPLPEAHSPAKPPTLWVAPAPFQAPPVVIFPTVPSGLPPQRQEAPRAWNLPAAVPFSHPFLQPITQQVPVPVSPTPMPADLTLARQLTREERYDEALRHLQAALAQENSNTEAKLLKAHILLNRKDFFAAESLAQQVLANDNWSIDALMLMGLASKWRQQSEAALRWFKQAVYTHQECWPAHYYLADLYRQGGDLELALRAYRVVLSLLSGGEVDTGIKMIPMGLVAGEIRFLCEHQMARLPEPGRPGGRKPVEH